MRKPGENQFSVFHPSPASPGQRAPKLRRRACCRRHRQLVVVVVLSRPLLLMLLMLLWLPPLLLPNQPLPPPPIPLNTPFAASVKAVPRRGRGERVGGGGGAPRLDET